MHTRLDIEASHTLNAANLWNGYLTSIGLLVGLMIRVNYIRRRKLLVSRRTLLGMVCA